MHILFIGIVASLIITEVTGYSPGGIVVAGYLALFSHYPVWIAGTIAAALVTLALVRFFETRLLLYGRRQFAVYLLIGMLVSQGAMILSRGGHLFDAGLVVVGYLVPGILARDFARQGILPTMVILCLTLVIIRLTVLAGEGVVW